ncbi:MAG: hypothetical protein VKJ64_19200 [Leptolyngbyaceae bacterium]|nr:hypothetical protein [Leptolyngbyaceae bacterium]
MRRSPSAERWRSPHFGLPILDFGEEQGRWLACAKHVSLSPATVRLEMAITIRVGKPTRIE